jgi:creatinine amidohydrolase/Fe(II)-dependent formamide hydrolase-like protein
MRPSVRSCSPRLLGELTSPEISAKLKATSILCLPLGAIEQHGPHLPLNTDVVVAEEVTRALVDRWGDQFDLWQLPTISLGLSREHDWAPGTLSLSLETFARLIRETAREIVRALPARNLAIINGHGGNRGALEVLLRELASELSLNGCALHPFDLAGGAPVGAVDVHGGAGETSVMLAVAPDLVRQDLIAPHAASEHVAALIFDRAVSFPWRTDDARLAHMGIIGDPAQASAEQGRATLARMVAAAGPVFARLLQNQAHMGKPLGRPPA